MTIPTERQLPDLPIRRHPNPGAWPSPDALRSDGSRPTETAGPFGDGGDDGDGGSPADIAADRQRRIARMAAGGTVAAILIVGAVIFALRGESALPRLHIVDPASDPAPPRRPPEANARARTRSGGWAAGLIDGKPFDVLGPTEDEPGSFRSPIILAPPYDVVDAITFRTPRQRVRLAGVEGIRRGDVCFGEDGLKFPCGLMGRAVMSNFLRSNRVVCFPAIDRPDPEGETILADCYLGATDLAERQIRAGLARPTAETIGRFGTALAAAQEAHVGAWNGGWNLMDLPEDKRDGL